MRLEQARTTKDVDMMMRGSPARLRERLEEAGRQKLDDHLTYDIHPDPQHPKIEGEGVRYEGFRFKAQCKLADKIYGTPFGLDIAFADALTQPPQSWKIPQIIPADLVEMPHIDIYPIETHLAEKLHAYTLPRERMNSRVKDLPDMAALLARAGDGLSAASAQRAIAQTFAHRDTHAVPTSFPDAHVDWGARYAKIARANQLEWPDLDAVTQAARTFVEPLLVHDALDDALVWHADTWAWRPR